MALFDSTGFTSSQKTTAWGLKSSLSQMLASMFGSVTTNVDANFTALENMIGANDGIASLDANGKVPTSQLPSAVLGSLAYQGVYDASSGSYPADPETGYYWVVSVVGTISTVDYEVGDWIVYNGTSFDKIDNSETVSSVNGQTGTVTIDAEDVGLGNVDNTADADKVVASAAKLTTARTINGVSFDGTENITLTAEAFGSQSDWGL